MTTQRSSYGARLLVFLSTKGIELGILVAVWYSFIGAQWMNGALPMGAEYPRNMHSFFFWEHLQTCGSCALWSDVMGGYPVFADVFGSFLHPLSMLMTLLYGAVKGSALTVAGSFLMIGLAAWWLGRIYALHPVARLWYAVAAMVGGHMASRLELGSVGMPLSIAAQWLSVVALIAFFRLPTLPSAMILGVAVGILMQAGQGYMQLAFVLVLPVFVAYAWYDEWFMSNRGAKVLLLCVAAGVALLLSAPLWLHLLTYPSLFSKDVDKTFSFAEPVGTLFQNMLVGTFDVAKTTAINNFAYPWAYSTYIGLTACLLAVVAPFIVRSPAHKKLTHLMVLLVVLLLFIASGTPQKMLAALHIPALTRALIGLRFLVILNGPATMAVLTLAALAVHEILTGKVLPARVQRLRRQLQRSMHVDTVAVIVLVFLTANIIDVAAFAKNWVYDAPAFSEQQLRIQADVAALGNATVTTDAEWMHMPLLEKHVNITNLHMAWQIDGAKFPRAEYEIRLDVPGDMHLVTQYKDNWVLVQSDDPETRYAVVYAPDNSVIPCEVPQARGGSILVHCDTPAGGVLRVFEHALWGWTSSVDGVTSTTPRDTDWITADVPPGVQTIRFTYQPWTATVAVLLWCLGWVIVAGVWLWSVGRWIHAMRQSTSHPTEGHVG